MPLLPICGPSRDVWNGDDAKPQDDNVAEPGKASPAGLPIQLLSWSLEAPGQPYCKDRQAS